MMISAPRDYGVVVGRLESIKGSRVCKEVLGTAHGYPIYLIRLMAALEDPHRVLISAGTHGDEPAGTEAVLRFLDRDRKPFLDRFEFVLLPCVNPYGYIHRTRENGDGVDINRSFEGDGLAEVRVLKRALQGQRFDLFIEFHEDWEYEGFYLYEERREGRLTGPEIIRRVERIGPVNRESSIDGYPACNGVVSPDLAAAKIGYQALPLYVYKFHSNHIVTCETPSGWDMERRIAAHLEALETVLESYAREDPHGQRAVKKADRRLDHTQGQPREEPHPFSSLVSERGPGASP